MIIFILEEVFIRAVTSFYLVYLFSIDVFQSFITLLISIFVIPFHLPLFILYIVERPLFYLLGFVALWVTKTESGITDKIIQFSFVRKQIDEAVK